jgi:hypothetical protein
MIYSRPGHIETGRRKLVKEACSKLKGAVADLTEAQSAACKSNSSVEWKLTCDCAMLGALHRVIEGWKMQHWNKLSLEALPARIFTSVSVLVSNFEKIRLTTIQESTMTKRQSASAHQDCTPWAKFSVEDLFAAHSVETLVQLDEKHFERQAAKSGIDSAL